MTRLATVLAVTLVPMALGLGAAHADAPPQGPTGALGDEILRLGAGPPDGGSRGVVLMPDEAFVPHAGPTSPIIYVNRCRGGCSFTKATLNDSISNQTTIGGYPAGTRMNLSEFGYSDEVWNQTIDCIKRVYQPFNVQIVTEDPGSTAHHEAVLAGRASEMMVVGALGISPGALGCQPQNNVVSFSYANDHAASPADMCWTVAQESAHAFGLEHEAECTDAMTYIPIGACQPQKYFRNLDAKCGVGVSGGAEEAIHDCRCGGTTQNSYQRLLAVHGAGQTPVPAPVVDIRMPADGATNLPATFSVYPTAVDPRGLHHLELWINGWKWAEMPGTWQKTSVYVVNLPGGVPDGVMDIKIKGCGDTGVCGEDQITVTRGAPCASADACRDGQKCEQGRCFWDPPSVEMGAACTFDQECLTETCANVNGAEICTEPCVSGPNDRCPMGYECVAPSLGAAGACGPLEAEGGCCSTGGQTQGALLVNLGLGSIIGLVVIRRRRRR